MIFLEKDLEGIGVENMSEIEINYCYVLRFFSWYILIYFIDNYVFVCFNGWGYVPEIRWFIVVIHCPQ